MRGRTRRRAEKETRRPEFTRLRDSGTSGHATTPVDVVRRLLLVGLRLDDLLAAVITVGADVVAHVDFSTHRFHGKGRGAEEVVRAMHSALRRRLLVLLDSHVVLLFRIDSSPAGGQFRP
jgi:hypothetical protein